MKETIAIHTEYIQLQQLLKLSGHAPTGGTAKEVIAAGVVKVNGEVCTMRGKKLRPGDMASWDDVEIEITAQAE